MKFKLLHRLLLPLIFLAYFVWLVLKLLGPIRRHCITPLIFKFFKSVQPAMSDTEKEALEAGDIWWDAQLFSGKPDWDQLLIDHKISPLTEEEQVFFDNQTNTLCAMIDDWNIQFNANNLPDEVWKYLKQERFFSMLISKEWGGLGFSFHAQSAILTKIATYSVPAAVTVMVPNSLGPGELLMRYGTDSQKQHWLPGLADGSEIPCFALTGLEVGSDATSLSDYGIVCEKEHNGKKELFICLTFHKRWITLAPVATVIGVAFKLMDPDGLLGNTDKKEYGITVALITANQPQMDIGRRHYPGAFSNGPINGEDIFVPLDAIIGGPEMAGKGWRMLVECLSAGRGLSLPAVSSANALLCYCMTGAYSRIRRQFKSPIGFFEGVQEANGKIAGLTYKIEACRLITATAIDVSSPGVITAIAKYHMTELSREIVNLAMDVHGGRGIQMGPRNYLMPVYHAAPMGITVEGANILTRNLIIFGQGSIRCHPYIFKEMQCLKIEDHNKALNEFDHLIVEHLKFTAHNLIISFAEGITFGKFIKAPFHNDLDKYGKKLNRMSRAFATVSDITMMRLGGSLKRKENLSARLGDILSELYMASAVIRYYDFHGDDPDEIHYAQWALEDSLYKIQIAFNDFFENLPYKFMAGLLHGLVFPWGSSYRKPADKISNKIAVHMMEPSPLRDRFIKQSYFCNNPTARVEAAFKQLINIEPIYNKFMKMVARGTISGSTVGEQLKDALKQKAFTQSEAEQLKTYDDMRVDALLTDAFSKEYLTTEHHGNIGTDLNPE